MPPPGGLVTAADIERATALVADMDVPAQAGTVIMASSADAVGTDLVAELGLGGVILGGSRGALDGSDNGTPAEIAALTATWQALVPAAQADAPLLVATDQENGLVVRLVNGFTEFPGSPELAAISDPAQATAQTEAVAAASAREMLAVGITVDFAPVADVLPAAGGSGVDGRTFGSDPERVASLVAAAVRGYQSAGLAATIKHFPGIGRLAEDTHDVLPTLGAACEEWNAVEAVPMRAGVDAGAALVMTGHILLPAVGATGEPSSLSAPIVTDLLRGDGRDGCTGLSFQGVAVSDSMQMAPIVDSYGADAAAWRALAAGQDLVLMPTDPRGAVAGIVGAVAGGQLAPDRLQQAAVRVLALRMATARTPRPGLDVVGSGEHASIAAAAFAAAG